MDMSIPVILALEWIGTALIIWGVWQLAFKVRLEKSKKEVKNQSDVSSEIRMLQRELKRL